MRCLRCLLGEHETAALEGIERSPGGKGSGQCPITPTIAQARPELAELRFRAEGVSEQLQEGCVNGRRHTPILAAHSARSRSSVMPQGLLMAGTYSADWLGAAGAAGRNISYDGEHEPAKRLQLLRLGGSRSCLGGHALSGGPAQPVRVKNDLEAICHSAGSSRSSYGGGAGGQSVTGQW